MRTVSTIAILLICGGCQFSRVVENGHVRELKTAWIVPGKTTQTEVVARLGRPALVRGFAGGEDKDQLHYLCTDTRTVRFEAGFIFIPTFERTRTRFRDDILISFNTNNVVQRVSRVIDRGDGPRLIQFAETQP